MNRVCFGTPCFGYSKTSNIVQAECNEVYFIC